MTRTGIAKVTGEYIVIYMVIRSTKSTLEENSTWLATNISINNLVMT